MEGAWKGHGDEEHVEACNCMYMMSYHSTIVVVLDARGQVKC